MFLPLLLLLGLSYRVFGDQGDCKKPKPLENFSMKKFSGDWFVAAKDVLNVTDAARHKGSSCIVQHFYLDNEETKPNKLHVDILVGKNYTPGMDGTYVVPEPNTGLLKVDITTKNKFFDFTVMCTDYSTWAISYTCSQISPGHSSEYLFLTLRDKTKYEDVVAKEEVQICMDSLIKKPVKEMTVVPQDNCPTQTLGAV